MKLVANSILSLSVMAVMVIFMSGCVEHRYYHQHHEHSPAWHHRHDPRIDVNIHN